MPALGAGEVVVALDEDEQEALGPVADALVSHAIPFRVMPSLFQRSYGHAQRLGLTEVDTVGLQSAARQLRCSTP